METQTKELNQRMRQIEELKEKERIANENVSEFLLAINAKDVCFMGYFCLYMTKYITLCPKMSIKCWFLWVIG